VRSLTELETYSTAELVETAHGALAVLATRAAPDAPFACMELAERLGAGLDLGETALAALVAAADRAGQPSALKYAGTRAWLKRALGMRIGRADERLTTARQLERLPRVAKLLAAQQLSWGYASTIAEAVARLSDDDCPKAEQILLELVDQGASANQVARLGARIKEVIAERDGTERPPRDGDRRQRSWWQVARSLGGGAFTKGWFTPQLVALIQERLGPLTRPQGPDDDRDHAERLADALEMLLSGGATRWNATLIVKLNAGQDDGDRRGDDRRGDDGPDTSPPARRATGGEARSAAEPDGGIRVRNGARHAAGNDVDDAAVSDDGTSGARVEDPVAGRCTDGTGPSCPPHAGHQAEARVPVWPLQDVPVSARLADGTPISSRQARVIAVNAGVSLLLLGADGVPLYLGGKVRFVTPAQRRVLEALYDTCAFTECDIPTRFCEIDHVTSWAHDGATDIDQLAPCCGWHNRLKWDRPDWVTAEREAGRWRYRIDRPVRPGKAGAVIRPRAP
jgi:uncharacterized protein DUF222